MDPALATEQQESSIDEGLGFGGGGGNDEGSADSFSEQEDLKNEMNQELGSQNGQDPFDKEIGWDNPEEDEEPEEPEQPTEGEEPVDDPEADQEEFEEDIQPEDESETDGENELEPESEEEEETFYDASRDFPDMDIDPTSYETRVELNEGVAAKVQYLSDLREQLQEEGANLGAIQLPELFGNSEDFLEQPLDRQMFSQQDPDTAKKTAAELDQAIKRSRTKLNTVQEQRELEQAQQEASEEYQQAVSSLVEAVDAFGIDRTEAERMRPDELLQQANQSLHELEEGEEGRQLIDDKGLGVYNQHVNQMRQHRDAIAGFPEAHQKHLKTQKQTKKPKQRQEQVSPEQLDDFFEVFREDNPNLDMFNSPTVEPENAFKSFVKSKIIRDGRKVTSPRDFITLHREYQDMLAKQSETYGKSKASKEKATAKQQAGQKKADRSGKKKPPIHKVKGRGNEKGDRLTTDDIDSDLDQLKKEMNNITQ